MNELLQLVKHGRKSIATVVSLDYIPVSKRVRINTSLLSNTFKNNESYLFLEDEKKYRYVSVETPRIRLRYKFNPPDDSETADLIHEVYLNQDIREELTPGQAFPILYMYPIESNHAFVISMPFPVPLTYLSQSPQIVSATNGGKHVSAESRSSLYH